MCHSRAMCARNALTLAATNGHAGLLSGNTRDLLMGACVTCTSSGLESRDRIQGGFLQRNRACARGRTGPMDNSAPPDEHVVDSRDGTRTAYVLLD